MAVSRKTQFSDVQKYMFVVFKSKQLGKMQIRLDIAGVFFSSQFIFCSLRLYFIPQLFVDVFLSCV